MFSPLSLFSKEMNLTACARARERVLQNQKKRDDVVCSECSVLLVRVRTLSAGHETTKKKGKERKKERRGKKEHDDDDEEK